MKNITLSENLFGKKIVIEPKNKYMLVLLLTIYSTLLKKSVPEIIDNVKNLLNSDNDNVVNIDCNTKEILHKTLLEIEQEIKNFLIKD